MRDHSRTMRSDISPPPLKRQRLTQPAVESNVPAVPDFTPIRPPTPGALRIFSWNVNGIEPFVQPYLQKSIKSFFKPATEKQATAKRKRTQYTGSFTSDSGDEAPVSGTFDGTEDPSKEGPASLRLILKRYGWPHFLLLQEVKIKPGDSKTMSAVRQAVNDASEITENKSDRRPAESKGQTDNTEKRLADGGPEYEVHFTLPADPYNAKGFGGKVYGIAAIVRKDFMSKAVQDIRDVPWDREGRIQIIETREISLPLDSDAGIRPTSTSPDTNKTGQDEIKFKFAIIHIYAVNGTSNPYRSTHTGEDSGTRHDRKLAVHTELLIEARALEAKGFHVIIAGDLNIARCELDGYPNLRTRPHQHVLNRSDFNNKFFRDATIDMNRPRASYSGFEKKISSVGNIQGLNAIDTFRHIQGSERRYSYHSRGLPWGSSCDRVDLIIASRSLAPNIVAAGIYDSPRDRGPSDHCPVWVEIGLQDEAL
ncbi:Endonuclease/exonuclease/phosphatase [Pestalotiopsis sp. NC0098]|nr:Endonuclease/exonuclease/phosphatase [Pestalotiopsis sp. NC0098]